MNDNNDVVWRRDSTKWTIKYLEGDIVRVKYKFKEITIHHFFSDQIYFASVYNDYVVSKISTPERYSGLHLNDINMWDLNAEICESIF